MSEELRRVVTHPRFRELSPAGQRKAVMRVEPRASGLSEAGFSALLERAGATSGPRVRFPGQQERIDRDELIGQAVDTTRRFVQGTALPALGGAAGFVLAGPPGALAGSMLGAMTDRSIEGDSLPDVLRAGRDEGALSLVLPAAGGLTANAGRVAARRFAGQTAPAGNELLEEAERLGINTASPGVVQDSGPLRSLERVAKLSPLGGGGIREAQEKTRDALQEDLLGNFERALTSSANAGNPGKPIQEASERVLRQKFEGAKTKFRRLDQEANARVDFREIDDQIQSVLDGPAKEGLSSEVADVVKPLKEIQQRDGITSLSDAMALRVDLSARLRKIRREGSSGRLADEADETVRLLDQEIENALERVSPPGESLARLRQEARAEWGEAKLLERESPLRLLINGKPEALDNIVENARPAVLRELRTQLSEDEFAIAQGAVLNKLTRFTENNGELTLPGIKALVRNEAKVRAMFPDNHEQIMKTARAVQRIRTQMDSGVTRDDLVATGGILAFLAGTTSGVGAGVSAALGPRAIAVLFANTEFARKMTNLSMIRSRRLRLEAIDEAEAAGRAALAGFVNEFGEEQ